MSLPCSLLISTLLLCSWVSERPWWAGRGASFALPLVEGCSVLVPVASATFAGWAVQDTWDLEKICLSAESNPSDECWREHKIEPQAISLEVELIKMFRVFPFCKVPQPQRMDGTTKTRGCEEGTTRNNRRMLSGNLAKAPVLCVCGPLLAGPRNFNA